jgi:hypothetical protein
MTRFQGIMLIFILKYNYLFFCRTRGHFGHRPSEPGSWPSRVRASRATAVLAAERSVEATRGYRRRDRRRPPDHTGVVAVASKWLRSAPGPRLGSRTAPLGLGLAGCPVGPRLARAATRPTGPGAGRPRSSARLAPSPSPSTGGCLRTRYCFTIQN